MLNSVFDSNHRKLFFYKYDHVNAGGAFLFTPWLVGIKYSKHITFCDTNTVILLIVVIIIDT